MDGRGYQNRKRRAGKTVTFSELELGEYFRVGEYPYNVYRKINNYNGPTNTLLIKSASTKVATKKGFPLDREVIRVKATFKDA